jgi:dTDP-4-dehydrorhamnose 3,5-epimerase
MIFTETPLKGAYIIEPEKKEDNRGFFARTFCQKEFESYGLNPFIAQCNISLNLKKGTVRGMHYQMHPYEEEKVVWCARGAIYDVIVDLRNTSNTYKKWFGVELSEDNYKMLYIPKGFAHGFQTLKDETLIFYQMTEYYNPDYARGIRWDDAEVGIEWPLKEITMSEKDKMLGYLEL